MANHQLSFSPLPLQKVSGSFASEAKPSETPRTTVKWADIPELALTRAGLERKAVAADMGKSQSWLSRALRGLEKLGWLDLFAIHDQRFWQEMVSMICEVHGIQPPGVSAEDQHYIRIGRAYAELQQQVARTVQR